MFELCALLAPKKTAKPRKAAGPRIAIGARVMVWGREGVVVGRHAVYSGWWEVKVGELPAAGFDRSAIKVL